MPDYVEKCMASYVESLVEAVELYNPQPRSYRRLGTKALLDLSIQPGHWVPKEDVISRIGAKGTGLQPWIDAGIVEKKGEMRRIRPEFYSAMKEAIQQHGW